MQQEEQQPPDDKTYDSIRFGDFKSYMERKKRKLKDQEQLMWEICYALANRDFIANTVVTD